MIKFENTEVLGWEHTIRGMRNPKNSWDKTDSKKLQPCFGFSGGYIVGENDMHLMTALRKAGTDHRKFMRMIAVYVDITAPLYWWKEFDTYKVGTVANSCSTMHKVHAKEFTLDDFSCEYLDDNNIQFDIPHDYDHCICITSSAYSYMYELVGMLNAYREMYLDTKDKKYWWQLIQLLPTSYNQKRTVMLNYEVLANIYKSRRNHKLDEWSIGFMDWIKSLPYSELITGDKTDES